MPEDEHRRRKSKAAIKEKAQGDRQFKIPGAKSPVPSFGFFNPVPLFLFSLAPFLTAHFR
jgi:hypothetical protein